MIDLKVKEKKDCTGCYACYNICPTNCVNMVGDTEGFCYPIVVKSKCISCGLCIKVCPVINKVTVDNKPVAYSCINKNNLTRLESSSGGIFTLLAEQVSNGGGVVFGAKFNEEFDVEHGYSEAQNDLEKFRGSKYVQSNIGDTFKQAKEFLKSGRQVLFTGTPCQIAGLKFFLGKPFKNLLCVDFVCHGVPSPDVWKKYVRYREDKAKSKVQKISFRCKNEGWKRFSVSFSFKNNVVYRETFDRDLYMRAFLEDICLRPSCYACEFKTLHRQSDITLADFWGIQNVLPDMDDDKGTSLVLINSTAGQMAFQQIGNKIQCQGISVEKAIEYNPAAIKSAKFNSKRNIFLKRKSDIPFDQLVKKYCSDKFSTKIRKKIKFIIRGILRKIGISRFFKQVNK